MESNSPDFTAVLTPQRNSKQNMDKLLFPGSPPLQDMTMFPWNWADAAGKVELASPPSDGNRRGRPRADVITSLIMEGSSSPSSIKCRICNRVFPREKSLQAHMRTHTGERPYVCDYPGCERAFAQSGQLKTHQRLHTGEKPFKCPAEGCNSRFTHANRHCPEHPFQTLQRVYENNAVQFAKQNNENNQDVMKWLENYKRSKQERNPEKLRDRKLKRELDRQAEIDMITTTKKSKQSVMTSGENPKVTTEPVYPDEMIGALALIQLANVRNATFAEINA